MDIGLTPKNEANHARFSMLCDVVPLTFALGEAFQFDWSDPSHGHEMLFDAHTRSFGALGGLVGIAEKNVQDSGRRICLDAQDCLFSYLR